MADEFVALPDGGSLRRSGGGDCEVDVSDVAHMRVSDLIDLTIREDDADGAAIFVRASRRNSEEDPLDSRLWGVVGLDDGDELVVIDKNTRELRISIVVRLPAVRNIEDAERRSRIVCVGTPLSVVRVRFYEGGGIAECEIELSCEPEATLSEINIVHNALQDELVRAEVVVAAPRDVQRLLRSGYWDSLLGIRETDWLEVKSDFRGARQRSRRHEFALDVSSLANNDVGGILVVGFSTLKDGRGRDAIADVSGGFAGDVSIPQIEDIMHEYVFPRPEKVEISVFERRGGAVLSVFVPPQPEALSLFLVKGSQIDSESLFGSGFTWVVRRGASKRAPTIAEVHSRLSG